MKTLLLSFLLISATFLFSCEQRANTEGNAGATSDSIPSDTVAMSSQGDTAGVMTQGNITLTPLVRSPEFPDAALELNAPEENAQLKPGDVAFNYEVKNYQLKKQTPRNACNECNNSKDGQHIHLILNNAPYIAIYDPAHKENLKEGNYVSLSFLSRSYHESIKNFQAYDLRQFTVGNSKQEKADLSKPLLFYSRPKGEYTGVSTEKILLDFFLLNTELSANGNRVRVTINGNEFIIPKWQAYIIEGLPMGENTVKIELIDQEGNLIESPFNNSGERKITLKQEAS